MQVALYEVAASTSSASKSKIGKLTGSRQGPIAPGISDPICSYDGNDYAKACSWDNLKPISADATSINFIQPHGDTRCMTASTPFTFIVEKGSKNDILLYLQAGGVCANQANYDNWNCNTHPTLGTREGVLNKKDTKNVFKDYTTIEVLYCSGDFHLGYNDAPFVDSDLVIFN